MAFEPPVNHGGLKFRLTSLPTRLVLAHNFETMLGLAASPKVGWVIICHGWDLRSQVAATQSRRWRLSALGRSQILIQWLNVDVRRKDWVLVQHRQILDVFVQVLNILNQVRAALTYGAWARLFFFFVFLHMWVQTVWGNALVQSTIRLWLIDR